MRPSTLIMYGYACLNLGLAYLYCQLDDCLSRITREVALSGNTMLRQMSAAVGHLSGLVLLGSVLAIASALFHRKAACTKSPHSAVLVGLAIVAGLMALLP